MRARACLQFATVVLLAACGLSGGGGAQTTTVNTQSLEPDEQLNLLVRCLDDAGWPAEIAGDGLSAEVPEDQQEAFGLDMASCAEALDLVAKPLSSEEIAALYELLNEARSCLADEGYATAAAPSFDVFADVYASGQAPWSPYLSLDVGAISDAEWNRLQAVCPQPTDYAVRQASLNR